MPTSQPVVRQGLVVALTGGIASGKSEVSKQFARLGVPIIDTDVIARKLVEPGSKLLLPIKALFGKEIVSSDGILNRSRLRTLVFNDESKRKQLEAILHPEIMQHAKEQAMNCNAPYCLLVIPLLAEHSVPEYIDRTLVVSAAEGKRLKRIMMRDRSSAELAKAMIDAQASESERLALADDVLRNDGTLAELAEKVRLLHEKYKELANARAEAN